MSYYGVKNLKIIKTESGYNATCIWYDSSIRSWDGKRVWRLCENLYINSYKTKEELERKLFEDFLDGNLHGSCGKFAPLNWHTCKIRLSDAEYEELKALEDKKNHISNAVHTLRKCPSYQNMTYEEFSKREELQGIFNEINVLRKMYSDRRYELYYNAWQAYLTEEKKTKREDKKSCKYLIRLCNGSYANYYIQKKTSKYIQFTSNRNLAKEFTKSKATLELQSSILQEYDPVLIPC